MSERGTNGLTPSQTRTAELQCPARHYFVGILTGEQRDFFGRPKVVAYASRHRGLTDGILRLARSSINDEFGKPVRVAGTFGHGLCPSLRGFVSVLGRVLVPNMRLESLLKPLLEGFGVGYSRFTSWHRLTTGTVCRDWTAIVVIADLQRRLFCHADSLRGWRWRSSPSDFKLRHYPIVH